MVLMIALVTGYGCATTDSQDAQPQQGSGTGWPSWAPLTVMAQTRIESRINVLLYGTAFHFGLMLAAGYKGWREHRWHAGHAGKGSTIIVTSP
jgi:hypothetical protein